MTTIACLGCLALWLESASWDTHVQAGITEESRGGRLALTSDEPRDFEAGFQLTPALALDTKSGARTLAIKYAPQLLLRATDLSTDLTALHYGEGAYTLGSPRGSTYRVAVSALDGTLDYASAARMLGVLGTLPAFPVGATVRYANADLFAGAYVVVTRRLTVELDLGAGYTGPGLGDAELTVQRQLRALSITGVSYLLTRRDTAGLNVQLSAVNFQDGPFYTGVGPQLTYARRMTRDTRLALRGGVQLTSTQNAEVAGSASTASRQPLGGIELSSTLARARSYTWRASAQSALAPFYDPFRATLVPRAVTEASTTLTTPRGLAATARAQWYQPLPSKDAQGRSFDTRQQRMVALSAIVGRPLYEQLSGEIGVIAFSRWQVENQANSRLRSPEILGFAAVTAAFDVVGEDRHE